MASAGPLEAPEPQPALQIPRWLRVWSWMTLISVFVLLALGQLVTSFQAGMADPIWPTEPWYLLVIDWQEPAPGYLIEHTHRIAGFLVGGLTVILAFGLWWTHPGRLRRWFGLAVLLTTVAAYGQFHGALMAQRHHPPDAVQWPYRTMQMLMAAWLLILILAVWDLWRGVPGAGVRLLGTLALAAVKIQGLLGGFRVFWDALAGTDLAAIHGTFAQCVLGLLLATAMLTLPAPEGTALSRSIRRFRYWTVAIAAAVFLQIALGVWLRHYVDPIAQRLHVLTAFGVVAGWVWLAGSMVRAPGVLEQVRYPLLGIGMVLLVQVYLGIEAWLVRYGAGVPPELAPATVISAVWRTAHALTGSLLWALSLAMMIFWWRYVDRGRHQVVTMVSFDGEGFQVGLVTDPTHKQPMRAWISPGA
ncbi:MAG: hypothetical protein NZ703_03065 [Gemmataceae bacterium]|nr:hypothetical protein [Gemmataceae bacterium]MCS7270043.1 hypothetical protein [Gemmataceae bacterium]MDW8243103.1 hypothetical protein [Thermogemmata sp.]